MPEHPAPAPAVYDTVELSRLVLRLAAAGGADSRALARDAGLPGWLLDLDKAMVESRHHARLWELAGHALQDPCAGLTAVSRHRVGDLDLLSKSSTRAWIADWMATTASAERGRDFRVDVRLQEWST